MTTKDFTKLNKCRLSFFVPICGEQHIVDIDCASFKYMPKCSICGDKPCILVNFDWEDDERSGAPKAVEQALLAIEYMEHKNNPLNTLNAIKFSSNGIIIRGIEDYSFTVITPYSY